jgi:glycosyltransferase involved in cell wall biosynthesis
MKPFISICIPAYKRVNYLRRLLDSITIQAYKNFEVIVTDDSPDDEVEKLVQSYVQRLPIKYSRNHKSLGTPENWNEAIRKATGDWIKVMHDDDWFTAEDSLQQYADAIIAKEHARLFFSAYTIVYEQENNRKETVYLYKTDEYKLRKNIFNLFRKNYIGNPSCTLFKKNRDILFDNRFQWVVDFEFYIRFIGTQTSNVVYINKPLVNVSVNQSQVTQATFRKAKIEIPENHILISEAGYDKLKNIYVYDYFWRLYRNLGVKDVSQVKEYGYTGQLHAVLTSMISWQRIVPAGLLKFGPFSKMMMSLHYITHVAKLK